ncbi:MAG: hypothetical protein ACR2QK_23775 [Acidimicrobiales bacterium]
MVELSGLETLARIVDPVAQRFVAAGHRIYLVGGVVRDLVLAADRPFDSGENDIDLTTDALPAEIKELLSPLAEAIWAQGERFGTIGARVDGQALEVTTHRAEAYDPASRKPVVSFGRELNRDLSRRDFTINAMAIEVPNRTVHDPYGGRDDLTAGLLRTPLSPEISFTDDPLRMMRAARFVSRFDLAPTPELSAAAARLCDRLDIVSVERVADELERLLTVADPETGLRFLADSGLLARILHPYGSATPADLDAAVRLAARPGEPVVRRAGLLWPIRAGADQALRRLRYSKAELGRTTRLIDGLVAGLEPGLERSDVRRIVARVGHDDVPLLSSLASNLAAVEPAGRTTDSSAGSRPGDRPVIADRVDRLQGLILELGREEDLGDLQPPLSGAEIIEVLGVEPGPIIGLAQRFLTEHRLASGPMTADEARELLASWWQRSGDRN